MRRLILALALAAAPLPALAQCAGQDQQAMSCAEGTMWDREANACVPIVTG